VKKLSVCITVYLVWILVVHCVHIFGMHSDVCILKSAIGLY